jgi:RHS repeat-associated protein
VWRAVYAPFGEATIDAASTATLNLRFPGQYYDQETGMYYNYFRYYDPETGRYMRSDPGGVLLDFSDPQRQAAATMGVAIPASVELGYLNHSYNYVDNNPLNRLDPTGEIDPVTAGAIIWSLLYFNHVGDMISDPNGNVWGEPQDQDQICTLPGPLGPIANRCVLDRCQWHDTCYEKNRCTASSWVSNVLGGTKSCNQCNNGFFQ